MKNLKKVLALGLSATMVSSMFVTAGAAFTDQKDIKATDAVNMLSALGVINGYEDGSYKPETVVTRAEMAKMIFVVRNNKVDDSAYQNLGTKFADIKGHWAAGYIKFCESQGIIAGKTATKFDPDAPVTGVEAAKMLLVLTGYTPDKAGLTGSMWATNTLRYAAEAGILDDVNSALEQGLPRQYAAQEIYNTLDAYRVKWSTDSNSFDYFIGTNNSKETVGKKYMGLYTDVGVMTDLSKDSLTIKIDSTYASDNTHSSSTVGFTKVKEDYSKYLGQKVKVMFKDGKTNNVLGIYAVSDNTVYKTMMNQVEQDGDKIKFGGTSYSLESNKKIATTFIGVDGTKTADQTVAYFDKGAAANTDKSNGNTSLDTVTFVDSDGNGKIDTAIVVENNAAEVTSVSTSKITFGGKSYNFSDETIDKNLAQDDWAVMSKNLYNDNKNIVKADVLSTTVNSYKYKDKNYSQYQLDGTWYNVATDVKDDAGVSTGDAVKAYVVNGVIVKLKSDDGKGGFPTNVAVVVGIGGNGSVNGDQARVRFYDGTSKVVTLADNSTITTNNTDVDKTLKLGEAYKVSGSDTSMKFEKLVDDGKTKYNGYLYAGTNKNAKPEDDKIGDKKVDDTAAVILYTTGGNSKQITGKQFNALANNDIDNTGTNAAKSMFTKEVNGLNRVMMASVLVKKTDVTGKSSDNYAYITTDGTENKDGNTTYTIWTTDNKYITVTEETSYSVGERMKGTLIGYSAIDSKNVIKDVDKAGTISSGTKITNGTEFAEGTMYYGGNESEALKTIAVDNVKFNVTADTKVLFVDSDADSDKIGQNYTYNTTAMRKAQKIGDTYTRNVLIIPDEKGKDDVDIKALVLDTTGAFKDFKPDDAKPNTPVDNKGDYTTTAAAVNVSDKTIITGAASTLNRDGDLTLQVTLPDYVAEATTKATATVNGVNVELKKANGVAAYDNKLAGGSNTLKIVGEKIESTSKVVITFAELAVTKVKTTLDTVPTVADLSDTKIDVTELAKAGATVNFKVTSANFAGGETHNGKKIAVTYTLTNGTIGGKTTDTVKSNAISSNAEQTIALGTIVPTNMNAAVTVSVTMAIVD